VNISAALIVKNEERTLGRCLDSIAGCVDEIVIVDTGSEDRTREVARQYTGKLFEFPWRKDFAAARQFSFDHATGDWVFWLDADDVVLHADQIRENIHKAAPDIGGFRWKYLVGQDEHGNSTGELWRERCVRNDGLFRWVGRVHEVLVPSRRVNMGWNTDTVVVHRRDAERRTGDPYRNLDILKDQYRRARLRELPRLLLCLGNEYADLGQTDQALAFLERYVRMSTWDEEKYLAQLRIAALLRSQLKYAAALDAATTALAICPRWPQAYFSLAETSYYLRDWPQVVHWAERGMEETMPQTVCVIDPMDYRYRWIIFYTNALYHLDRMKEVLHWTDAALAICPSDPLHRTNRPFFAEAIATEHPPRMVAVQPPDAAPPLTVQWHAPLFDASGYAEEARQFVLGLDAVGVHVQALPFEQWTSERIELPPADDGRLRQLVPAAPATHNSAPVVSIVHLQGHNFRRVPWARYHIGRTMCETDRIPADWVASCNQMDEVWVPCAFNVESFHRSGVERDKLVKIPEGIDVERFRLDAEPLWISRRRRFNFLSVFQWSRRKGWDLLIRAFAEEFRPEENVGLIVKVGYHSGHTARQLQERMLAELRAAHVARHWPPHILLYQGNLAAHALPSLYRAADAFVLPTRGEGWGRPLMEAMLMGLPTIATRYSGHLEFMNDENAYLIDCQEADVDEAAWQEATIFRGHRWAAPSVPHLRQLMRQVYEDRRAAARKGQAAREHIATNFSRERVAEIVKERLQYIADGRLAY
jgi:glycosyltransferase involved in cell wall biosynthesis